MNEPSNASAVDDITISVVTTTGWRELAGIDPRGYQWGPPGTYVIASDPEGRQLGEVRFNYAHRLDGTDAREEAIALIVRAFTTLYPPRAGR